MVAWSLQNERPFKLPKVKKEKMKPARKPENRVEFLAVHITNRDAVHFISIQQDICCVDKYSDKLKKNYVVYSMSIKTHNLMLNSYRKSISHARKDVSVSMFNGLLKPERGSEEKGKLEGSSISAPPVQQLLEIRSSISTGRKVCCTIKK